jgi:hypothetical protein
MASIKGLRVEDLVPENMRGTLNVSGMPSAIRACAVALYERNVGGWPDILMCFSVLFKLRAGIAMSFSILRYISLPLDLLDPQLSSSSLVQS